jgi:hypothetical protein
MFKENLKFIAKIIKKIFLPFILPISILICLFGFELGIAIYLVVAGLISLKGWIDFSDNI